MNTLGKISWLVSLLAVSSATACNSDDDGDSGDGDSLGSGVDSDKQGEDLTEAEVKTICDASGDYFEEVYSADNFAATVCRYAGVRLAVERATSGDSMESVCDAGVDLCMDCVDDPEAEGCEDFPDLTLEDDEIDCSDTSVPDDCSATVSEIEACLKAIVDLPMEVLSGVPSCSAINEDTEVPVLDEIGEEMPAECERLEDSCPEILE